MLEQEPQFQQKVLRNNINRIMEFTRPLIRSMRFVDDILSWKNRILSSLAIVVSPNIIYYANLMVLTCITMLLKKN